MSGVAGSGRDENPAATERFLIRNGWWFLSARWRFLRASWQTKSVGARYVELAVGRIIARLTWGRAYASDDPWTKVGFEIVRLDSDV